MLILAVAGVAWLALQLALEHARAPWLGSITPALHLFPFAAGVYAGGRRKFRVPLIVLGLSCGWAAWTFQVFPLFGLLAAFAIGLVVGKLLNRL